MQFINNEPEQIEIRKARNTLIVVGSGTVLFSAWTAVKILSIIILLRKEIVDAVFKLLGPVEGLPENVVFWIVILLISIIMAVILGVRMYVGLSAIAVGRGRRRRLLFILIAVIMIIGNIWAFISGFFATEAPEQLGILTENHSLSAFIIDATSVLMLTQMVISAIKIRKLT